MNFWLGISVGLKEIAAHKFRSALTILGIVLGVASLVGMLALVAGMTRGWQGALREIGIRKAIGARPRDIFVQVLVESTVLAGLGGLLGLAVAFGLVWVLGTLAPFDFTPEVQPAALLVGFLFSAAVGVLAGVYPAWKAARYDPIEALRYE